MPPTSKVDLEMNSSWDRSSTVIGMPKRKQSLAKKLEALQENIHLRKIEHIQTKSKAFHDANR